MEEVWTDAPMAQVASRSLNDIVSGERAGIRGFRKCGVTTAANEARPRYQSPVGNSGRRGVSTAWCVWGTAKHQDSTGESGYKLISDDGDVRPKLAVASSRRND